MGFISEHTGELAALATACFWTVTALSFESASKRVGSLSVNLIRLIIAFGILSLFNFIHRGMALPLDADGHTWFWLILSGVVGFVIGDLMLFESYTIIGSRIAMLVMTLVPPITALAGWILLGEVLTLINFLGMALTLGGIGMAIFGRPNKGEKIKVRHPIKGLLLAFGGAVGQAVGLVLSKFGMGDYDAFSASQIRILTGAIGFALMILTIKRWNRVTKAVQNRNGMLMILVGSIFGPFLGVSFSLLSVQRTSTGIASTIMAIVPVFIIIPSILIFKEKFTWKEILGAFVSVGGVVLFFI
jgi:drug/metabolite transporter (DMT)-like permease